MRATRRRPEWDMAVYVPWVCGLWTVAICHSQVERIAGTEPYLQGLCGLT